MPVANGTRLGPYEVVSLIGAGGQGEVYKAKDTRLGRIVAIKVLPSGVSDDPERRERFEREARAVASLSHPHICTPYDVGQHEGIGFLVMEHLEGETLADRLKKGAIPLEKRGAPLSKRRSRSSRLVSPCRAQSTERAMS